jgi:hypothetical protein
VRSTVPVELVIRWEGGERNLRLPGDETLSG